MKKIKLQTVVLALLALTFLVNARAQESFLLQYKFQKGKTHRYRVVSNNDVTQEMQGQEMKSTSTSRSVIRLKVDDVLTNGSMVVVISADSMSTRTKNPMMDTTLVMKGMIGKRVKVTLDATGKVLSREVIDSLKTDMAGLNTRTPQREVMNILSLPEKPLKAGETWTDSRNDTADVGTGKILNKTDITFTLVGKDKKRGHECLKVTYTGKISTNGKMSRMGMDIFTEGTGKISGTLYFDYVRGLLLSDESSRDIESTLAITGQQNMTMPMSTSTANALELLED